MRKCPDCNKSLPKGAHFKKIHCDPCAKKREKECNERWRIKNNSRFCQLRRESRRRANRRGKLEVLTYYGKGKKAVCRWRGCDVSDLDMLTLDHVNNDGAKELYRSGGADMKSKLSRLGWPETFQTLCWNHQWKKELIHRRSKYEGKEITDRKRNKSLNEQHALKEEPFDYPNEGYANKWRAPR